MTEAPTTLDDLERIVREDVGVRLFTVLEWVPERRALRRIHSSHPEQYLVGGVKTVEVSPEWLSDCVDGRRACLGADVASVREVFADHELIESLGCGSFINVPVVDADRTLAILCLLAPEGAYDQLSLERADRLRSIALEPVRTRLKELP